MVRCVACGCDVPIKWLTYALWCVMIRVHVRTPAASNLVICCFLARRRCAQRPSSSLKKIAQENIHLCRYVAIQGGPNNFFTDVCYCRHSIATKRLPKLGRFGGALWAPPAGWRGGAPATKALLLRSEHGGNDFGFDVWKIPRTSWKVPPGNSYSVADRLWATVGPILYY